MLTAKYQVLFLGKEMHEDFAPEARASRRSGLLPDSQASLTFELESMRSLVSHEILGLLHDPSVSFLVF